MKLAEFKEEIIGSFMDSDALVTVDRRPGKWSSGNSLLISSLFYSVLAINNAVTQEDKLRFTKAVDLCWVGSINPIVGLLERNDGRPDLEAHDDYHIATASMLLGTYHAEAIWNWGDSHCWSFNNENPNKWTFRTWHKRFLGHVPYLYVSAGKHLSILQKISLLIKFDNIDYDHSDVVMMSWLKLQSIKKMGGLERLVDKCENELIEECGSLGEALKSYFGKDHPFSKIPGCGIWE